MSIEQAAPETIGAGRNLRDDANGPARSVGARFARKVKDSWYETLPATHETMIWTAAIWQLSNRLTR
jgi:hypothetical protein